MMVRLEEAPLSKKNSHMYYFINLMTVFKTFLYFSIHRTLTLSTVCLHYIVTI